MASFDSALEPDAADAGAGPGRSATGVMDSSRPISRRHRHGWRSITSLAPETVDPNRVTAASVAANRGPVGDLAQRVFDAIVILATLPFTLPCLLVAAYLIKREDGGPIMFFQERVGRDGKVFLIYKLRTMSEGGSGAAYTEVGDRRVTEIGKRLRRFRIDELPQLVNILRGQMALCGPRPEALELVTTYRRALPNYDLRHAVRPGLTGWAQVHQGYAAGIDEVAEKLRYDLFYAANRSVWMDFKILLLTVRTLVTGDKAR